MVVEHAHRERQRDFKHSVVQVRRSSAARVGRAYRDGGREDQGGNVAGERDNGRSDGCGFGRHVRDVIRNRRRRHGDGEIAVADSGVDGDDVGRFDRRVWLDYVACVDEGGGYGGGGQGEGRRQVGILGACCADDARIKGLQNHRCGNCCQAFFVNWS